jgi:hypothetical protein
MGFHTSTHTLLLFVLLAVVAHCETVALSQNTTSFPFKEQVIKLTTFPADFDMASKGTPWLSLEHGFNLVAFDGWTCSGIQGPSLNYWINPHTSAAPQDPNSTMEATQIRQALRDSAQRKGVKLLVNAFSSFDNPASSNISAQNCANALASFVDTYGFDGANLDFRDTQAFQEGKVLPWLTQFLLTLGHKQGRTLSVTLNASLYNLSAYSTSDPAMIEKAVGDKIDFYALRYYGPTQAFSSYTEIFQEGAVSVE